MPNYDDLLLKKFKKSGRGPNGYDCWGLAMEVTRRAGINMIDFDTWVCDDLARSKVILEHQRECFQKLIKPEPFCMVTFKVATVYVNHMGVVLENCQEFIHIREETGVAIENLNDFKWLRRIEGFYRYQGQK